ncbi:MULTISPECIES: universal stress protein [unclassified Streptomyces]|uniref:universal stress protein n=1 Tax=unclassified Streptomyces TaxID=2593676 RepID=UPI0037F5D141
MNTQQDSRPRIVVGVDGSPSSKEALAWAVRQASLVDGVIDAVIAWEYPQFYGSFGWMPPMGQDLNLDGAAAQVLDDTIATVTGAEPAVTIHSRVEYGTPAGVLLAAAEGASLLVLGNRGHGGFAEALLGSVGQHCTQHSPCPIVIVRGQEQQQQPAVPGPEAESRRRDARNQ